MVDEMINKSQQKCFACAICIGPGYKETYSYPLEGKVLCGHCYKQIKRQGYLIVDYLHGLGTLMPNGELERRYEHN